MSPDLKLLAVSERSNNSVVFVDIDLGSPTFHQIVHVTPVGHKPRGIAWEPGNEDVLVCNEGDGTVSVISASQLRVRKTLRGFDRPFAIAITPRQDRFGFARNVYFAYILDRAGQVSLFESGPSGALGWGFDNFVLHAPFTFSFPTAIQADPRELGSGVWITHAGQLDAQGNPTHRRGGAVTNLVLESSRVGMVPLRPGEQPNPRGLALRIERSIGSDQLSGRPLDIAFDDLSNLGALANYHTPFSSGSPAAINGKNLVRDVPGQGILATNAPRHMFVVSRPLAPGLAEAVDVIDLETGLRADTNPFHEGIQSIPAAGARLVMDYFRQ
jgi:hypothetical protein